MVVPSVTSGVLRVFCTYVSPCAETAFLGFLQLSSRQFCEVSPYA